MIWLNFIVILILNEYFALIIFDEQYDSNSNKIGYTQNNE